MGDLRSFGAACCRSCWSPRTRCRPIFAPVGWASVSTRPALAGRIVTRQPSGTNSVPGRSVPTAGYAQGEPDREPTVEPEPNRTGRRQPTGWPCTPGKHAEWSSGCRNRSGRYEWTSRRSGRNRSETPASSSGSALRQREIDGTSWRIHQPATAARTARCRNGNVPAPRRNLELFVYLLWFREHE